MRYITLVFILLCATATWAGRSFNGTSDIIIANGIGSALDISTGPQTISFWAYPTSISGSVEQDMVTHFNFGSGAGQFIVSLGACSTNGFGQFSFAVGSCAGLNPAQGGCGGVATANHWYQVTLALDPSFKYSGSAVVFNVNGFITCQLSVNGHTRIAGTDNFSIGALATHNFFPGIIAEVAVWNDILSPAERVALRTVCPSRIRRTALVGYFPLWGNSSPEPDLGGNKLNGALTGTTAAKHPPCTP